MTGVYGFLSCAVIYLGVILLSSKIRPMRKLAANLLLGMAAVWLLNRAGADYGIAISIDLFTVVVTALCGPVGIIVLLVTGAMGV